MDGEKQPVDKERINWLSKEVIITTIAVAMSLFHLYTAVFGLLPAMLQRGIHITFALMLAFLAYPLSKKLQGKLTGLLDWLFATIILSIGVYTFLMFLPERAIARGVLGPSNMELLVSGLLLLLILEGTRRTSLPLAVVCLVALLYAYAGPYIPGTFAHKGYSTSLILDLLFFSTEGVFGLPLGVSATFIVLFIILGAFLEYSGAGQFFVDLAHSATGSTKSGPAMSAVLSSAMMGTISGSSVANVVTTGTFTIPLMKRVGYKPSFAGAVEAVASSGGQIMPPVMGASAFIMAEFLGITYGQVALAAAIPAVFYYVAVGIMVHLEAEKLGLKGLPRTELPDAKKVFLNGVHYLIPLIVLIYLLMIVQYTPTKAAIYAIGAAFLVSYFRKFSRMDHKKIFKALESGAKNTVQVAVACAAAGIVIGVVTLTGLGLKFSYIVISVAGSNLVLALLLTMVTCLILGMGLPTAAAYIITAALGAPALIKLGVTPIAAHIFVLYFACISSITPPVALAAYAGAAIAKSDPMKTGWTASRLGITAFIVPYMCVYGNELLLIGSATSIIQALATGLIGVFFLSLSMQGWFWGKVPLLTRGLLLLAAMGLIKPGTYTDLGGLALGGLTMAFQFFMVRRRQSHLKKDGQPFAG